jgi:NAD dependent epimerase/dehydratase family enzyme
MVLGKAADELVLTSCRATPGRLLASGFEFQCAAMDRVLDRLLIEHSG